MNWHSFMEGSKSLPTIALVFRTIILYLALIAATRLMGHRQVGTLAGHNYLVASGIVSLAAIRMLSPESSLSAGLVIILVYTLVNVFLSYLDLKFPNAIDRKPVVLMKDGILNKKNLLDSHVTLDNLLGQLRLKGIHNLSEVDSVVLEAYGKVSVIKKANAMPVTRKQMNMPLQIKKPSAILIYDGKVENRNLSQMDIDEKWLMSKLNEKGIMSTKSVFLALLESDGSIYISI